MHMCVALQTPSQTKSYLTAINTSLACVPLLRRNLMPGRPAAWSWRCAGAHVRRVADPVPNRIISDREQNISGMCPIAKAQLDAWQTCSLVVAVRRCTCASRCRPRPKQNHLTAINTSLACVPLLRRNLMPGRPAAWSWRCAGAHVRRVADPVPNRIISDPEQYISGMCPIAKAQLDAWQTLQLGRGSAPVHMCVALQTLSQTESYLTASSISLACMSLLRRNLMPGRPAAWSWRCAGAHVRRVADPVPNRIISDREQNIFGMCPIAKAQLDAWQTCSLVVAVRRCTCASRCRPRPKQNHI